MDFSFRRFNSSVTLDGKTYQSRDISLIVQDRGTVGDLLLAQREIEDAQHRAASPERLSAGRRS